MFLCIFGQMLMWVVIFELLSSIKKVLQYWTVSSNKNLNLGEWIEITKAQWFSLFGKDKDVLKWDCTS